MSAAAPPFDLLSRDEIGALLEELRDAREQEHAERRLPGIGDGAHEPGPTRALRRGFDRFAVAYTRLLASRFQRRLALACTEVEELRAAELAELLLPRERLVSFRFARDGRGFVWIPRALLAAWMRLAFGARTALRQDSLPDRAPTPIERRFLRSVAAELLGELGAALGVELVAGAVEDASALRDARAARLIVATFDPSGFEEIGRVRVALSREILGDTDVSDPGEADVRDTIERAVLDAEVVVTAGAGRVLVPLSRIATLAVGDTIPIDASADDLVTVTVDGAPKFRAQRGRIGTRLAVQVVERLAGSEE